MLTIFPASFNFFLNTEKVHSLFNKIGENRDYKFSRAIKCIIYSNRSIPHEESFQMIPISLSIDTLYESTYIKIQKSVYGPN